MSKSRKANNLLKTIGKTTKKVVPVIGNGLKTIGSSVSKAAVNAAPVVKNGAKSIYGTLKTGFNLGVKGVKSLARSSKKSNSKSKSKKRRNR